MNGKWNPESLTIRNPSFPYLALPCPLLVLGAHLFRLFLVSLSQPVHIQLVNRHSDPSYVQRAVALGLLLVMLVKRKHKIVEAPALFNWLDLGKEFKREGEERVNPTRS